MKFLPQYLLDPAPRSASATALTETRLFRLDQVPFYELLENHSDVARSMLQVLARCLRRSRGETKAERAKDDLLGGLTERLAKRG
jgi:CRP-like cAMP-binding protein